MILYDYGFYVDRYKAAVATIKKCGLEKQMLIFMHKCGLNECFLRAGCDYRLPSYEYYVENVEKSVDDVSTELLSNLEKVKDYAELHHLPYIKNIITI